MHHSNLRIEYLKTLMKKFYLCPQCIYTSLKKKIIQSFLFNLASVYRYSEREVCYHLRPYLTINSKMFHQLAHKLL